MPAKFDYFRPLLGFGGDEPCSLLISRPKANIRGHIWHLRQVRKTYRPETPEGAAYSSYVRFLFGLICERVHTRPPKRDIGIGPSCVIVRTAKSALKA